MIQHWQDSQQKADSIRTRLDSRQRHQQAVGVLLLNNFHLQNSQAFRPQAAGSHAEGSWALLV